MKSEFLESELELYVQRLLVHESYNTDNRYKMLKISPSEERLRGYDAQIVGLTPFYCQFKTSDFITQGKLYNSRAAFLSSLGLPSSPFYSFGLRVPNDPADKKNPLAWQHNILHSLWKNNPKGVAYVAPMFHTRAGMELYEPVPYFRGCPLAHQYLHSCISSRDVSVNSADVCRLPFFDGLVSIPPHVSVTELKHSYAFTSHRDVTFHSQPEFVDGVNMLGKTLEQFVTSSTKSELQSRRSKVDVDSVRSMLGDIGNDKEFLKRFLSFGLMQAGAMPPMGTAIFKEFSNADFLEQHIAVAASMQAYFGISTLALLNIQEE